jgi:lipopolysaccharide assembly protein A
MRLIAWLLRALLFFVLFAFALNNQHDAEVRWFFGLAWRAPMVFIVLAALALGCLLGALAMLPSWWHQRRRASRVTRRLDKTVAAPAPAARPLTPPDAAPDTVLPVRPDGL